MQALHSASKTRFETWLSDINDICGTFAARELDTRFKGSIQRIESSLEFAVVNASHAQIYRTRNEIKGCEGKSYFFVFQAHGNADMEQAGNRSVMGPGDIVLIDSSQPCNFHIGENSSQISLIVSRDLVQRYLRSAKEVCGTKVPASSSLAGMANKLVRESIRCEGLAPSEGEAILESLVTLIRPAFAERFPERDQYGRAFQRAVIHIDQYIGDPFLRSEQIAQEIGTSPRTLYRAFAEHGYTIAQYIRDRRLELFAKRIRESSAKIRLSSLGYELGFTDSSHLSTAFKAKFGIPPREYRLKFHKKH